MKYLLASLLTIACYTSTQAGQPAQESPAGPGTNNPAPLAAIPASANAGPATAGVVRFQFKNLIAGLEDKDSMLIIFDRYDHTGAGIIYKVFVTDKDGSITIPAVPPGKYFVTIQCVGLHRDVQEKIISIRSKKSDTIKIKLTPSEAYAKNKVFIPAFRPKLSDLAIASFH